MDNGDREILENNLIGVSEIYILGLNLGSATGNVVQYSQPLSHDSQKERPTHRRHTTHTQKNRLPEALQPFAPVCVCGMSSMG